MHLGGHLKDLMLQVARATTVPYFQRIMQKIKEVNEGTWKELHDLEEIAQTKLASKNSTQCDLQVNNNKCILKYRDKPIIDLLERIKFYSTKRIVKLREEMMRYKSTICPKIQLILEKNKKDVKGWTPNWSSDDQYSLFEVCNYYH